GAKGEFDATKANRMENSSAAPAAASIRRNRKNGSVKRFIGSRGRFPRYSFISVYVLIAGVGVRLDAHVARSAAMCVGETEGAGQRPSGAELCQREGKDQPPARPGRASAATAE